MVVAVSGDDRRRIVVQDAEGRETQPPVGEHAKTVTRPGNRAGGKDPANARFVVIDDPRLEGEVVAEVERVTGNIDIAAGTIEPSRRVGVTGKSAGHTESDTADI